LAFATCTIAASISSAGGVERRAAAAALLGTR
jgi:hypothetical protein